MFFLCFNSKRAGMNFIVDSIGHITISVYGEIGVDVNGHDVAKYITEFVYESTDIKQIDVRINSQGGNVVQGMSLFTALYMVRKSKTVITHIDGVALSMAGVIAMAGHKVMMNDFSRLMIHNPFSKKNANDPKTIEMVEQMRTMLADIFSNMKNIDIETVQDLMNAETWFNANEAFDIGLVDEIVRTGYKADIAANTEPDELVVKMNAIINKLKTKTMDLKNILAALSLDDGADETKVIDALKAKDTAIAQLNAEVVDLKAKIAMPGDYIAADVSKKLGYNGAVTIDKAINAIDELNAKAKMADELQNQVTKLLADRINEILAAAVADRKFPATQKPYYKTLLQNDFETGKLIIAGLNPVQRIADFVASTGGGEDRATWKWEDYQEKDSKALQMLEKEAPEVFARLFENHYGKPISM